MNCTISSIHYCPVKSVSFQSIDSCEIKKNIGIVGDRIFAFAKDLDANNAKYPAEHNVGHLYKADHSLEYFYRKLDPTNTFNSGIGKCSKKKNYK